MALTIEAVIATEVKLGRLLPDAFKESMLAANGGWLTLDGEAWRLFPFWDPTDRRSMRRTAGDLGRATLTARASGLGFPEDGVAIGENGAGDLLLLRGDEAEPSNVWILRLRGGELAVALKLKRFLRLRHPRPRDEDGSP